MDYYIKTTSREAFIQDMNTITKMCTTCGGTGTDPYSENQNTEPCATCGGTGKVPVLDLTGWTEQYAGNDLVAIDWVGQIVKTTIVDEVETVTTVDGEHVNLRWMGETEPDFSGFVNSVLMQPATPARVWA